MEIKSGVKLGRDKFDWQMGGNSPIEYIISVDHWKKWKPQHEIQVVNLGLPNTFDTSSCVTYSYTDALEYTLKYLLDNGFVPATHIKFLSDNGYLKDGLVNFNERFTAVMGKTNKEGAYFFDVANGGRHHGLIPQDMFGQAENFEKYIDERFITKEMRDMGEEFLKYFSINYEWTNDISESLKHGPVLVSVKFANYKNPDDILSPDGSPGHAVLIVEEGEDYYEVDESYWQEFKRYAKDKVYQAMAFKITINKLNNMDTKKFLEDNDKKWVQNSNNGQFGRILRNSLYFVKSTDRGALMLLDDKMRTEPSIKITQEEWDQLPKVAF